MQHLKTLFSYSLSTALTLGLCFLLLYSCDDELLHDDLFSGPQTVIHCYLYPGQQQFEVKLHATSSPFTPQGELSENYISDATVLLANAYGDSLSLLFDESTKSYRAEDELFPVQEGEVYALIVTENSGVLHKATTQIPYVNRQTRISIDSVVSDDRVRYNFELVIPDSSGIDNYYHITGLYNYYWYSYHPYFDEDTTYNYYREHPMRYDRRFSDERRDGVIFSYPFSITHGQRAFPLNISYLVMHLDVHTYKYWETLGSFDFEIENPFSTEPVVVYSNFDNARGVFGSYSNNLLRQDFYSYPEDTVPTKSLPQQIPVWLSQPVQ